MEKIIEHHPTWDVYNYWCWGNESAFVKSFQTKYDAPSIDIEPKQGKWVSNHDGSWNCSECGLRVFIYAKGNYCPNCGVRLKRVDDE